MVNSRWFTFGHFEEVGWLVCLVLVLQQGRVFDEAGPLGRILGKPSLWQGQRLGQEPKRHRREQGDESCNKVSQPPGAYPACISGRDANALCEKTVTHTHTHTRQQRAYRRYEARCSLSHVQNIWARQTAEADADCDPQTVLDVSRSQLIMYAQTARRLNVCSISHKHGRDQSHAFYATFNPETQNEWFSEMLKLLFFHTNNSELCIKIKKAVSKCSIRPLHHKVRVTWCCTVSLCGKDWNLSCSIMFKPHL